MTFQEIIASQNFTELETKVLNACNLALEVFYGEVFSDVDVTELAKTTNMEVNVIKGVIGSLVKKGIMKTESYRCGDGKTREFVYFADQENM